MFLAFVDLRSSEWNQDSAPQKSSAKPPVERDPTVEPPTMVCCFASSVTATACRCHLTCGTTFPDRPLITHTALAVGHSFSIRSPAEVREQYLEFVTDLIESPTLRSRTSKRSPT